MVDKRQLPQKPLATTPPPTPIECGKAVDHPACVDDLIESLKLSEQQQLNLNSLTKDQNSSELWHKHRHGRLTSSNFHRIVSRSKTLTSAKCNKSKDVSALLKSIMGLNSPVTTKAMKHGQSMENHAKFVYKRFMSRKHKRFIASNCGFVVDRKDPFLGASPDLLVECECHEPKCGKGLCEIKCPESISDQTPNYQNYSAHLEREDGITRLSKRSPYYYQVQGQMHILRRAYCDFFVYTEHGYYLERICFDDEFWQECFHHLSYFWRTYVASELIHGSLTLLTEHVAPISEEHSYSKSFTDKAPLNAVQVVGCRPPFKTALLPRVYLCSVCTKETVAEPQRYEDESIYCFQCKNWCHFICGNINYQAISIVVANTNWKCPKCV